MSPLPPPDAFRDRRHPVAPPNVLLVNASLSHRRSQACTITTSDDLADVKLEKLLVEEDHTAAHAKLGTAEKTPASSRIRSSRRARIPYRQTCLLTSYRSWPAPCVHKGLAGAPPPPPPDGDAARCAGFRRRGRCGRRRVGSGPEINGPAVLPSSRPLASGPQTDGHDHKTPAGRAPHQARHRTHQPP